jgi:hypothetical protein
MFHNYLPQIDTQMLWNVIAKKGLPKSAGKGSETLTVYDPCSCRYNKEQQQSVRRIVKEIGFTIDELEMCRDRAQCCSYGGLIYSANPNLRDEIVHKRIAQSDFPYVTYCVNCKDTFLKADKRSYHILDLLFGGYHKNEPLKTPTLGMRRENRLLLKQQLCKELWGETMKKEHLPYMDIALHISDEVQRKMEKKLILIDDVKRVIYYAQSTGSRMRNTQKDCYIAYLQEGIITFWAEYRILNSGAYELVNVYSHRVKLGEKER